MVPISQYPCQAAQEVAWSIKKVDATAHLRRRYGGSEGFQGR